MVFVQDNVSTQLACMVDINDVRGFGVPAEKNTIELYVLCAYKIL
jgi:hypothetical protein